VTEGQADGVGADAGRETLLTPRPLEDLRFTVIGAYVADCFVSTPLLPSWGDEYEARSIRTSPGGKALNQAVALARLGAQVAAVGAVGDDGIGRDVLAALARERVDTSWVESRAHVATTICLCFVSDDGDSAIVWHIDDDMAVTPETVRAADSAIERADAVLTAFEMPADSVRESIRTAKRHGCQVFVQPAPVLGDPGAAASLPWEQVDVLVPNETEARALLPGDRARDMPAGDLASAVATELGVPTVVVTLGASGCVVHAAGASRRYPAHTTVPVDTTGASDAFMATLAAYLTAGVPESGAIDGAQAAAVLAIQRAGGHESMPAPASPT
jgi:ribokinase